MPLDDGWAKTVCLDSDIKVWARLLP